MTRDRKRTERKIRGPARSRKLKASLLLGIENSDTRRLEPRTMPALSVTSFSIPLVAIVQPLSITTGPDGNLWFTENGAGAIGRMTAAGTLATFTLPQVAAPPGSPPGITSVPAQPVGITAGPDGALWFTTENSLIGRITTNGTITEFKVSGLTALSSAITPGPDGALWFTGVSGKVGRITTAGVVTGFPLPAVPPPAGSASGTAGTPATAIDLAASPDGALWFTGVSGEMGRITTAGVVTEFPVPATMGTVLTPIAITAGPDGALWFTAGPGEIGRITTAGVVTEFTSPSFDPESVITVGPDGALWFSGAYGDIGRITTAGVVTKFSVPGNFSVVASLTRGPNGNLWFTEQEDGSTAGEQPALGEITPAGVSTLFPIPQGTTLDPSKGVHASPGAVITGPDGALWFTENGAIGRITTDGTIKQFPLTTAGADPVDITSGPDGALWFTQYIPQSELATTWSIGRITTSGAITLYPRPAATDFAGITAGPGGKIYFTENDSNPITGLPSPRVGWITPRGKIKTFLLPAKNQDERKGILGNITVGPNGNVWFLDSWGAANNHTTPAAVVSITARGQIRMYQFTETEKSGSYAPDAPTDLIAGPNGKLWFLGEINNKSGIARISTSGKLGTTIPLVEPMSEETNLVKLSDGRVRFELTNSVGESALGLATRSGITVSQDLPGTSLGSWNVAYGGGTFETAMTLGPDGNLWATSGPSTIVRISGIDTLAGALDYRHGRQHQLYFTYDGYAALTETAHPTFAGVARPGAEVTLWVQKQGESQPVSIGKVRATGIDGNWTLKSHVKLSDGRYAVTATQNGDTGSPTVLYSLQPDGLGNLANALWVNLSPAGKAKVGKAP